MPDAVQQAVDGLMVAFEEFKATNDARLAEIERKGAADPVVTDKLARIEATLNQFEGINQKLTAAQLQAKAAQERDDELKTSLEKIELRLNRPGAGGHDAKADRKAYFADWARGVTNALSWAKPTWAKASARRSSWRGPSASRCRCRPTPPAAISRRPSTSARSSRASPR